MNLIFCLSDLTDISSTLAQSEHKDLQPEMEDKQNRKTLHAWLLEHKLEEYHERLVAEGVKKLDDFKELEERDIKEMMNKWNVGILPQRVFLKKVSGLMLPSYDSVPPPLPAAKEEQPPQYQAVKCSVHNKQVETWCVVDKKLICLVCIAEDHHGHKCENLQSAAESARKEISSSCDSARQMLAKTVACKAAIENSTARVEEACAAEEKKIRLRFQEVRAHEVWKSVRCILLYLFNFLFYDYNCYYYYFYYDYCYYDYLF